ncbi:DNA invertase Pin-like site-specific DNA recombinase [Larkinella arboricola]|uniref:DNA invertase Pin-like site-specific DNA recombinase n=1 Tax=Larkinella arboricola TaxID=643671 RepID=A0A327WPD8_LARAB|nr:recombinase family protein [Larkinella arboricola]RAJ94228.1 DNA invertase Pin-like site-specific DNA recombinase [Larkinella arboricola]
MLIGYARVSTTEQNPELQQDALKKAGCEKVFTDKVSGTAAIRPELNRLKEQLRKGDVLVVWRLDRLGRSVRDLIDWMAYLEKAGVALKSLHESIDTTSNTGKLVFHIFAAVAEFERELIRERTMAGLESARSRGRKGGRNFKVDSNARQLAIKLYDQKTPIQDICNLVGISKQTLYSYVRQDRAEKSKETRQPPT